MKLGDIMLWNIVKKLEKKRGSILSNKSYIHIKLANNKRYSKKTYKGNKNHINFEFNLN